MRKSTSRLLTTAAAVAFAGALAGSASAFEIVDWEWNASIQEDWDIDVSIQVDYDPTGIVKIEKLQMHFGDVNSFAKVFGIHNNPPIEGGEDGLIQIEEYFSGSLAYSDTDTAGTEGSINPILTGNFNDINGPNQLFVELDPTAPNNGNVNEQGNNVDFRIKVSGEIPVEALGEALALSALPEVVNTATSVANNQQIVSSSALMLHDAQIAAGGINPIGGNCDNECGAPDPLAFLIAAYLLTEVDDELDGLNEHTDIAALTILGAATGFIEPADIDADAWAFWIDNATVDNSATAVGNNASYEIDTTEAGNATMIADLTQLLIGNVNAVALAGGIEINNYDLTDIDAPIVSNVATAVGNNLNIKVGVGGVEAP
jgi:hypothetical protein